MAPHWQNCIVLPKEQLVVALPRKAACTSMKRMLWKAVGLKGSGHHEQTREGLWDEIDMADAPDEYEWVGVIREPYARLWSGMHQAGKGATIKQFIARIRECATMHDAELDWHIRPQRMYLQGRDGRIPSRWLVVEHLEQDWNALCKAQCWPRVDTLHANKKNRKAVRILDLPDDVIQILHRRWADDFRLYAHALEHREGLRD